MPHEKIISRYFELGGRLVTLGSDAHIEQNASVNFDEAIKFLKKIGRTLLYEVATNLPSYGTRH